MIADAQKQLDEAYTPTVDDIKYYAELLRSGQPILEGQMKSIEDLLRELGLYGDKVNGKKLYELAREGKEIERKSRTIEVYDIRIRQFLPPDRVEIDVDCSKGTYIRTLCNDIGESLGCGGFMKSLVRTKCGGFSIENSITLEEFEELYNKGEAETVIVSPEDIIAKKTEK